MGPSRSSSGVFLTVAGVLTAALILAVEAIPAPATSLLLSGVLQTAIVLWAGYCALQVARRSVAYLRQLWTLFAVALFIAAAAQGLEAYYQNAHVGPTQLWPFQGWRFQPWPSDILFFLWVTPAVMMLVPRAAGASGRIVWQEILDFAQVAAVALTAYLYFFYAPSRWQVEGPQVVERILQIQMLRDAALGIVFIARAEASRAIAVRALFRRMAVFFFLTSSSGLAYFVTSRVGWAKGNWNDVAWCVPYLFAVVFAATWRHDQEQVPQTTGATTPVTAASQVLPVGIPLVVLLMGRSVAAEQLTIAWIAVAASFLVSAARLVLASENQRRSEQALRVSEQQFRNLIEELHVGVALVSPDMRVQFVNQSGQEMLGLSEHEILGKKVGEVIPVAVDEDGNEIPFAMRPVPRAVARGESMRNVVIGWKRPAVAETLWVMGEVLSVFRENGELDHLVASFSDVTQRKQAEERLHQLSAHLLQLQDDERRRLGRELHDSLAQSVMAVNLDLAQVARSEGALGEGAKRALSDARGTLREMSREIRTLSYMLHPPVLDEMGLASAVKEYAEGFSARSGIELKLELQPDFGRLPQETETALFRIVQESLGNIQKHSGSRSARVRLRADSGEVELEVHDQGRGLDKGMFENRGEAETRLGVGIMGMRERMAQLGGKLDVESTAFGTIVRAKVKVVLEAAHAASHLGS